MKRREPLPRKGPRRDFLAAAGVSLLLLSGCGFKLREAPQFSFKSIAIPANSAFANYLRRDLKATGTVQVMEADQAAKAEVVLEILGEVRDNTVVSIDSSGQVRDLLLRLTVRFRLHAQDGRELLGVTQLSQSRDIAYNETAALAKQAESELLFRDMQSDIAQQVVRRLAAVK
jgi:LPS-assembly lipoprotein